MKLANSTAELAGSHRGSGDDKVQVIRYEKANRRCVADDEGTVKTAEF